MTKDPNSRLEGSPPTTVGDVLAQARMLGVGRLDAQLLLSHFTGWSRSQLITRDALPLDPLVAQSLVHALAQRADGVPLAYLTGWREFFGLRLQVGPAVLDPRADTEVLVEWALQILPRLHEARAPSGGPLAVLDLGTGSGAIALALAAEVAGGRAPSAVIMATDRADDALAVAACNAERLGLPLRVRSGAWWSAVGEERFDLAVSNPPYIRADDPHLPALRHEPHHALVSGDDGLDDLRALVTGAPAHLRSGGWLLLEHGHDQGEAVARLLREQGFGQVQHRHDLAGHCRCTGGQWMPSGPA
jgi:release factor glutamine methyltransferase